jgi:hypothetical protein
MKIHTTTRLNIYIHNMSIFGMDKFLTNNIALWKRYPIEMFQIFFDWCVTIYRHILLAGVHQHFYLSQSAVPRK